MAKVDVIFLCVVLSPVLFSCVSSSNDDTCIVTNRKNTWKTILGTNFYYSVDNFTNPIKEKYFCTARNSTCKTVKCKECSCKYNDTNFLSYQHGCLSYSHITDVLQGIHSYVIFTRGLYSWECRTQQTAEVECKLPTLLIKDKFCPQILLNICIRLVNS